MHLIETEDALRGLAGELAGAATLFLDTEFESRREGSELCLVQLSRGAELYVVDALKLPDLSTLRPAFEGAEWVVHAGQQDVHLLERHAQLTERPRVFDTQIAWALTSVEHSV